jgi:hypothetical protein
MRLPGLFLTLLAVLMLLPPVPVRAEDVSGRTQRGRADALHAAVVRGDRALVRQLLQAGADPNAQDAQANTPLMLATDVPMVELLVAGGANARAEDAQGRTLVGRIAATASREESRFQLLKAVVRAGADMDRSNRAGETPLEVASRRGNIELVRTMLWLGARVPRALEGTSIRVALPMPSGAGVRLAEEWGWHGRELVFRRLHVRLLTSAAEAVSVPLELGSPLHEALEDGALELAVDGPDDQPAPAAVAQQTESVMMVANDGPWILLTDWKTGRSAWTVAPALAPGRWQLSDPESLPTPFPAFTPGELEAALEREESLSMENRSRWLAVLRQSPKSAGPAIHLMRIRLRLASGAVKTLELEIPPAADGPGSRPPSRLYAARTVQPASVAKRRRLPSGSTSRISRVFHSVSCGGCSIGTPAALKARCRASTSSTRKYTAPPTSQSPLCSVRNGGARTSIRVPGPDPGVRHFVRAHRR